MARRADESKLKELLWAIETHPGRKAGFFARLLNWSREKVSRELAMLADRGVLLYEDERGGLALFDDSASE